MHGAEAVTVYCDPEGNVLQPALTRFINPAGGRVAVMASSIYGNDSANLFCYRKKELLRLLLHWLHPEAVAAVVLDAPNTWLLVNRDLRTDTAILQLNNLGGDSCDTLKLALAPRWQKHRFLELDEAGEWQPLAVTIQDAVVTLPGEFRRLQPRFFLLTP